MSVYCKKLCVLKQLSSGFAADGKKVSGLLTAERYGNRLTTCFSLINFAPLSEGRYVAVLSDTHGTAEYFELTPAGGTAKRESALEPEDGFCCLICHVANRAAPAAFGKSGEFVYDVKRLCAALEEKERGNRPAPAVEESALARQAQKEPAAKQAIPDTKTEEKEPDPNHALPEVETPTLQPSLTTEEKKLAAKQAIPEVITLSTPPSLATEEKYDDEIVATENYYAFADADFEHLTILTEGEKKDDKTTDSAHSPADGNDEGEARAKEKTGDAHPAKNEDGVRLFEIEGGEPLYFDKVKEELYDLFEKYPAETALQKAVEHSKWVKIEFAPDKYYTVGILYENEEPRYICYGVPAESKGEPPAALKGFCSYLPLSLFDVRGKGYWMMYQDARTGRRVEISAV